MPHESLIRRSARFFICVFLAFGTSAMIAAAPDQLARSGTTGNPAGQNEPGRDVYLPPYQLVERTPNSTSATSPAIDPVFFGEGGGIVISEPEGDGNLHLYVGALGSPESEWSVERKDTPNQMVTASSALGITVVPKRAGNISVSVEYRVVGGMGAEASYWASGLVPLSLVDASIELAEDYLTEVIVGTWSTAVTTLIDTIQALFTFSLADETTRLSLTTKGQHHEEVVLLERRVLDAYPSFPVIFEPGGDKHILIEENHHVAQMDFEAVSTEPTEVWVELSTTASVWGWASAASRFDIWVDKITVTGEALRPLAIESELDGVVYEESDPVRFLKEGDEILWRIDQNGNKNSRYLVQNSTSSSAASGFWRLNPTTEGSWEVYVFISPEPNATRQASYTVEHNGRHDTVQVSQADDQGHWVSLGEFHFAAQGDEGVRLGNATGESAGTTVVVFDSAGLIWKGKNPNGTQFPCPGGVLPLFLLAIGAFIRRKHP